MCKFVTPKALQKHQAVHVVGKVKRSNKIRNTVKTLVFIEWTIRKSARWPCKLHFLAFWNEQIMPKALFSWTQTSNFDSKLREKYQDIAYIWVNYDPPNPYLSVSFPSSRNVSRTPALAKDSTPLFTSPTTTEVSSILPPRPIGVSGKP